MPAMAPRMARDHVGTTWTRPTIQPAIFLLLGARNATRWTKGGTEPQVTALDDTRRHQRQRTLNPQVLGSNPRGRTKEQVRALSESTRRVPRQSSENLLDKEGGGSN